jgi:predicted nucleic-acid-binding protein
MKITIDIDTEVLASVLRILSVEEDKIENPVVHGHVEKFIDKVIRAASEKMSTKDVLQFRKLIQDS